MLLIEKNGQNIITPRGNNILITLEMCLKSRAGAIDAALIKANFFVSFVPLWYFNEEFWEKQHANRN